MSKEQTNEKPYSLADSKERCLERKNKSPEYFGEVKIQDVLK